MQLSDLIERVENLTCADRAVDLMIAKTVLPDVIVLRHDRETATNNPYTHWEYTGSIDGAVALTERLLPGWTWRVSCRHGEVFQRDPECGHDGYATSPALALVLATLRAYAATHPAEDGR